MSGFDVRLADARRSRALTFFGTLGLALLVLTGLLISRVPRSSSDAEAAAPDPAAERVVAETERSAPEPEPLLSGRALVRAEHEVFTGCADCRPAVDQRSVTVRRGQTFASVLDNAGAGRVEAARAIAALDPLFPARDLRAGQDLTLYFEPGEEDGTRLAGLSFRPDADRTLTVARHGDAFRAREAIVSFERELVRADGEVDSSLYLSAIDAGATDRIVVEAAKVLGFAVDFRAIYPGDTFDVVFERFVDPQGEVARTGDILYLAFDGRGEPLEYFRYETPDGEIGYYTAEGESARRMLMMTPINGARLSSHFGMRFHPVLQTNRRHNGTDFAAPRGTPIMAAGHGVVERANRYGSFGNYVRIRHSNGYKTAYAHMQGFARGVRSGARVQQGQTIGYVGTTGRSTGPHLHYEVHLNGDPVNPMQLDLPTGRTLEDEELPLFEAERDRILAIRDAAPDATSEPSPEDGLPPLLVAERRDPPATRRGGDASE
ncbi:peptidase M23 [Marinicauda salina]|uniref:Peptidase M23 n=1 Tax=Marinicauda salina TaxID=2135793 RepID=A0A2U2BS15_9PROT|nr:M23 family metallopeptidase [Marinicauda salina]PWE16789.1 peptidase M23 [Marinicauda salina]